MSGLVRKLWCDFWIGWLSACSTLLCGPPIPVSKESKTDSMISVTSLLSTAEPRVALKRPEIIESLLLFHMPRIRDAVSTRGFPTYGVGGRWWPRKHICHTSYHCSFWFFFLEDLFPSTSFCSPDMPSKWILSRCTLFFAGVVVPDLVVVLTYSRCIGRFTSPGPGVLG